MNLRGALVTLVVLVVTVALVPVGLLVRQQTRAALDQRMRADLERAPVILEDRWASIATVRMMHARDLASLGDLSEAMDRGDITMAMRVLTEGAAGWPESPVLFDSVGRRILGTANPPADLLTTTRDGGMPVSIVEGEEGPELLALAPVKAADSWIGAAGGSTPMDDDEARTLSGLTDTEVVVVDADGVAAGSSLSDTVTATMAPTLAALASVDSLIALEAGGRPYLATSGELPGGVSVFFLRDVDREMAIVPELQRSILMASAVALGVAIVLGGFFSTAVASPVADLADAADHFRAGDVARPLPESRLADVERLSAAFRDMRQRLAARLEDLESANTELEDRQERLASLQAELVQRERRLATSQLVTQLAHEIRNPIASIRNSLEVIRRETPGGEKAGEFVDLAIEELLRMHELTEQMLAMNRPREDDRPVASPGRAAREVARLVSAGGEGGAVSVVGDVALVAGIPEEGLKQVLLNLILNAREASEGGPVEVLVEEREASVVVQVLDRGPGIDDALLTRVFDPFFTTKDEMRGVGLGLFIAEAIVRRYEGSIRAENRGDGRGALFEVVLPAVRAAV